MDLSYFEETIQELVTAAEYDEEGAELAPAVYQDVQVTRARPQHVSQDDLVRLVGKKSRALDKMIELNQEAIQWAWFDSYQEHLQRVEEIEAYNALNVDVEGFEPRTLPNVPVKPTPLSTASWRAQNYGLLRQSEYGTWQEQMDMLYEDQNNGTTRFKDAIEAVKTKYRKPA